MSMTIISMRAVLIASSFLSLPNLALAQTTQITQGAINGNGAFFTTFGGASTDASRVFFTSDEPLAATDTDASTDVYVRDNGVTTQISQGAINGNGAFLAFFRGASADGSRVFFTTGEPLVASDTDARGDLYLRANGVTTHVSPGAINGNGAFDPTFSGTSADGSRMFFESDEPLAATDTDAVTDLYMNENGVTTHISQGAINGNGAFSVFFRSNSTDGSRVFFLSNEPLAATDTDASFDLYLRENGVTTLISQGAINGNGAFAATFGAISADGSRVLFSTAEPLVATDTDASTDIYLRENGVTTLISQGAINGNGAQNVLFGLASLDGSRVFFRTNEQLAATDTDANLDLYMRETGVTTHISQGAINGNGAFGVLVGGISSDGSRVFFTSDEPLAATDTDASTDIYLRESGVTSHVSQGTINGNGALAAAVRSISTDGSRVFFSTDEPLVATDTDASTDIYMRENGVTTHVSTGAINGNGAFAATFSAAAADGSRVIFSTSEPLAATDTDTLSDLYVAALALALGGGGGSSGALNPMMLLMLALVAIRRRMKGVF